MFYVITKHFLHKHKIVYVGLHFLQEQYGKCERLAASPRPGPHQPAPARPDPSRPAPPRLDSHHRTIAHSKYD